MTEYILWFLVTAAANGLVAYSPPMRTVEECRSLRDQINQPQGQCVWIKVMR